MKLGHQKPRFIKNPDHCRELDKSKNLKSGMLAPAKLNFNLKHDVESVLVRQCGQNGISSLGCSFLNLYWVPSGQLTSLVD